MTPEQKTPDDSMDLDFTKPEDKVANLRAQLTSAERAIKIEQSMTTPNQDRILNLENKKRGFEQTLALLATDEVKSRPPTESELNKKKMEESDDWSGRRII